MINYEIVKKRFTSTNLKNGLSYWKKDQFDILENSSSYLLATVYGTDEYRTELFISNDGSVDAICTCPNNRTLFCKHVAILYYEKFKEELAIVKSKPRKPRKKTTKPYTSKKEQQLLRVNSLNEVQLRELILDAFDSKEIFTDYMDTYFSANAGAEETYKTYKSKIQKILTSGKRYGYIDYRQANKIGYEVIDFTEKARNMITKEHYDQAFAICRAIIDKMIKFLNFTDTSSGIFYQGLDIAIDLASQIASDENITTDIKKGIFDYMIGRQGNKDIEGWDYRITFLKVAIEAVQQTKDREKLEKIIHNDESSDLYTEDLQLCLYDLVKKFDGDKAAKEYARKKILFPEFRRMVYQELLNTKAYEEAKKIMYDGIQVNNDFRGIVFEWRTNLLHIAQLQEDSSSIKKISEELFLLVGFDRDDFFLILKKAYADDWPIKSKEIEIKLQGRLHWLSEFYYVEKNANALLGLMIETEEGYYLGGDLIDERFIDLLLPEYEENISKILINRIHKYLKFNANGKKYKRLCEQLIKLKKKGCDINPLIAEMKTFYSRRPSLMSAIFDCFGV